MRRSYFEKPKVIIEKTLFKKEVTVKRFIQQSK